MEEWIECSLGEIVNFRRGYDLPHSEMKGGNIPVAGSNGVIGYHDTATPTSPCITIGRSGNVGTPYMYEKAWAHNTTLYIDNFNGNDPLYVYYLLKTLPLSSFGGGSAVPTLNRNHIHPLIVKHCKNVDRQKEIAGILKSFDDKIELNNRINHNLEEQAQALYKCWFVDFEPFKNGEFVESELGMIPNGWRVGRYNDIVEKTVSGDWGQEFSTGNYTHKVSCIRGCDFADVSNGVRGKTPERYILEKNFQSKRLNDKDIIVEISGGTPTVSTGRICLVSDTLLQKYSGNLICTNFCRVARPKEGYSSYVFYSWLHKYQLRVMFGYENGTSGIKNFQISDFLDKEPLIIPTKEVICQFQKAIDAFQSIIQRNGTENMVCEKIRDGILPKLMSGKLNINELDC